MSDVPNDSGRIFRSAAVFLAAALLAGCADPTRVVADPSVSDPPVSDSPVSDAYPAPASASSAADCTTPPDRGRKFAPSGSPVLLQFSVALGDTMRLSRAWPSGSGSVPGSWRVEDTLVARLEGDLVVPMTPGRTLIRASATGRTVCVSLTTLFTGVTVTSLSVDRSPIPMAGVPVRATAALRYSNGLSVRVQDAATWTSLDPAVADISASAWVTPRVDGLARIVATAGSFADTASIAIGNQRPVGLPARRAGDFVSSIGVNVHISYFDKVYGSEFRSVIVPRLRELGVRHLRDGGTVLPNEDWMREVYGRWRELADATGAQFTVIINPRRTATGPGTNYGDASHILELRDRIGANRIAAWEGINEHDLSGRPDFASEVRAMQQAMFRTVKGDPELSARHVVVGPSLANVETAAQVGDLSAFMDEGAIHPYDGGQTPTTNLQAHAVGVRPMIGNRPLQATEVGYHTAQASTNPWHWAVTELAQAKYTMRQFLELYNAGVRRSFAYELIDEGTDASDMESFFGLLRNDGSRKPAFDGLRNIIALLDDRTAPAFSTRMLPVRLTGDTAGVHRLVLEKADGRRYLVLWQNTLSFDKVSRRDVVAAPRTVGLEFDAPMAMVNVYIPLNGMGAVGSYRQVRTVQVGVPDHPLVVELFN